jgi:hypothetical protein
LWFGRAVDAFVVGDIPAVGGAQGDALGAVMRRAATEGNDEIAGAVAQLGQALLDVADGWVRLCAVEYDRLDIRGSQQRGDLFGDACSCQSDIGDDQRLRKP